MTEVKHTKPWETVPAYGRQLRLREVASITGLSKSQIYLMISEGRFPPLVKIGSRASALPEPWLEAFIQHRADETLEQKP